MRDVVRTLKAMLQDERRDVRDWVGLVPAVQWALNTAFRDRYASTPYHVLFGRAPPTSFSTLASSTGGEWRLDVLLRGNLVNAVSYTHLTLPTTPYV